MPDKKPRFSTFLIRASFVYNPVLIQALGLCLVIAATTSLKVSLLLSCEISVTLIIAEALTALIIKNFPNWVRVTAYMLIGLTVACPSMLLLERVNEELLTAAGVYLPLISVNALVAVRCERYATKHKVKESLFDGVASSVGFSLVMIIAGIIREVIGSGTIWGKTLPWDAKMPGMLLPFGGLIVMGFMSAGLKSAIAKIFPHNSNVIKNMDKPIVPDKPPVTNTMRVPAAAAREPVKVARISEEAAPKVYVPVAAELRQETAVREEAPDEQPLPEVPEADIREEAPKNDAEPEVKKPGPETEVPETADAQKTSEPRTEDTADIKDKIESFVKNIGRRNGNVSHNAPDEKGEAKEETDKNKRDKNRAKKTARKKPARPDKPYKADNEPGKNISELLDEMDRDYNVTASATSVEKEITPDEIGRIDLNELDQKPLPNPDVDLSKIRIGADKPKSSEDYMKSFSPEKKPRDGEKEPAKESKPYSVDSQFEEILRKYHLDG